MTNKGLTSILTNITGLPMTYSHFSKNKVPPLPYGIYKRDRATGVFADGKTEMTLPEYTVELYTAKKSTSTEEILENIFNDNDITYEIVDEQWLESESMYMVTYSIN